MRKEKNTPAKKSRYPGPATLIKKSASVILYGVFKKKLSAAEEGAYWSERAKDFEEEMKSMKEDEYYRTYDKKILSEIQALNNVNSILEVGCYYGYRLSLLRKSFPDKSLVGCDLGHRQLAISKQKFFKDNGVGLVRCNAAHLPFKDNSFDLIFTSACLQHVPNSDIDRIIGEFRRVSKKYLLLVEVYLKHMSLRKRIEYLGINYFYMHDYEKILKKHGFQKLKVFGIPDKNNHCRYSLFLYSK